LEDHAGLVREELNVKQVEYIQQAEQYIDYTVLPDLKRLGPRLGKRLPAFPEAWKTEANRLQGCQSKVWIVPHAEHGKLYFSAASDSSIVSGLVYLALRVYSGRSPEEIRQSPAAFVQAIGLSKHLSPTRSNGFSALLAFIQQTAESP
jgi:cysteine desulfuration protein SufE